MACRIHHRRPFQRGKISEGSPLWASEIALRRSRSGSKCRPDVHADQKVLEKCRCLGTLKSLENSETTRGTHGCKTRCCHEEDMETNTTNAVLNTLLQMLTQVAGGKVAELLKKMRGPSSGSPSGEKSGNEEDNSNVVCSRVCTTRSELLSPPTHATNHCPIRCRTHSVPHVW